MSNDNLNSNIEAVRAEQERLRRQSAEVQRDVALNVAADQAVQKDAALNVAADHAIQRDAALNVAADQAAQRDAAATAAGLEAVRRQEAEQSAAYARTAANQASYEAANAATERNILRENLAAERADASNANFGFYMMAFCVLAALIGLGVWYFNTYPTTTAYTGQSVTPVSSTTITTPPPPVNVDVHTPVMPAPSSPPVIVNPPPQTPPAQPSSSNVKVDVTTHTRENATPPAKSRSTDDPSRSDTTDDSTTDPSKSDSDAPKSDSGGQ